MYPNISYISIPAWDCMPYDNASPNHKIIIERIKSFFKYFQIDNKPRIIFITINGLIQKNVSFKDLIKENIYIKTGDKLNLNSFYKKINVIGYKKVPFVMEVGEYAIRGGIIDIFSPSYDFPLRIDLFGEDIESIKFFDILTQISNKKINSISILPTSEIIMTDINVNNFISKYRMLFGLNSTNDQIYQQVKQKQYIRSIEHWISLFYEKLYSFFELIDDKYSFILDNKFIEISEDRFNNINDYFNTRKVNYKEAKKSKETLNLYKPLNIEELYLSHHELQTQLSKRSVISLSLIKSNNKKENFNIQRNKSFWIYRKPFERDLFAELIKYMNYYIKRNYSIIIACSSSYNKNKMQEFLNKNDLYNVDKDDSYFIKKQKNNEIISIMLLNIEEGFIAEDFVVISENDIFGKILKRKSHQKKQISIALEEADNFEVGDYLVHQDYGVGKYNGLKTLKLNNISEDCIELIYLSNDKLLLPVQYINLISKFAGKLSEVSLDKLGSKNWINKKEKTKKKIRDMAESLIRNASKRKLGKAVKLYCNEEKYENFISKFPYHETEDQIDVINDVLNDISSEVPMDRLVCGDVGFGKTEIAIRAAFVAVQNNAQVAIIAPTTLLVKQHFETFSNRLKDEEVNIVFLSRLKSNKLSLQSIEDIKSGKANIIIGTHALLSDKIIFKNLGLFVIDEEQRFGVNQKEKLKNLTSNIHVLSLTATPIPRTLHMSLSGIKELSIIATAPEDRLPVRTFVMQANDFNIKEGIKREFNRNGQVFCIVPRIRDIESVKDQIINLIGELNLGVIHGKMSPLQIENTINKFYDGEIKILLSTTIIENGLDIPNANTIFIFKADMFGLSQLYQLRGRVGRSYKTAYAYYLLDKHSISNNAEKRIHAIQTLEGLGAGFNLAAHDLDIRGAGNLLGEEQSGQIKEVGLSLYQKLLNEAVKDIKDNKTENYEWTPQINLQVTALIPENYVQDLSLRLQLYRRLGNLKSTEDFKQFEYELNDRFGQIPLELKNLFKIMKIKSNALLCGINRIDTGINGAIIEFINNPSLEPKKYIDWISKNNNFLRVKSDEKLLVNIKWNSSEERIDKIYDITSSLTRFRV